MAVEAPRPEEGRVERLGAVGRRHHDHATVGSEAVHLDQQRIERLLALVMAADDARAASLAEGVELVDEDDAGGLRLRLLEHVADTGRTDADEHLDEVATGEAKERHPRLPRDGLGQERLAGAGGADEEYALGDMATEDLVFLRVAEEFDDLAQLLHRLVDPGHVVERDPQILLGVLFATAAAEGHRAAGPPQTLHHREEEEGQQAGEEEHRQPAPPRARGLLVAVGNAELREQPRQPSLGVFAGELGGAEIPALAPTSDPLTRRRAVDPTDRSRHAVGSDDDILEVAVADETTGLRPGFKRIALHDLDHAGRIVHGAGRGRVASPGARLAVGGGRRGEGGGFRAGRWPLPRGPDELFEVAVGELELRRRRQETHREQSGDPQGDHRPDEIRPSPGRLAVSLPLRKIVLFGHE